MRKTLSIILSVIMVLSLCIIGISAADGEKISNPTEFLAMKADGTYYLDADLVITASYGAGETPVPFTGTLDGNGHTVTVTAPVFASLGKATVKNLTIEGEIVANDNAGALAAYVSAEVIDDFTAYAVIENCVNKAKVTVSVPESAAATTYWGAGGFIGKSVDHCGAMFIGCTNDGEVSIKCPQNNNDLKIKFYAGGFAGVCDTFLARESVNNGNVFFDGTYDLCLGEDGSAGFVGRAASIASFNYVNIESCINNGNIKGGRYAGGFISYAGLGSNTCQYEMGNTPYRFYSNINTGDIEGKTQAGGIAGYLYTNGSNEQQTFDMEFNLTSGKIASNQWCSYFIGYSNSVYNKLKFNVSTAELAKVDDSAVDYQFVFLGCSSVNYRNDAEIHDNYVVDEGNALKWLCYSTGTEGNRIEIAWGIENNYVTRVTPSQLATGEIAYKINKAANANGFNQTLGTDQTPTPSKDSAYVAQDGNSYKNATTAEFDPIEFLDVTTEEVTTKGETTKKETTAAVTTAAPVETTDAPAGDDTTAAAPETTAAPAKKGCKSVIGIGVAIVAVLGAAYVSKKKF